MMGSVVQLMLMIHDGGVMMMIIIIIIDESRSHTLHNASGIESLYPTVVVNILIITIIYYLWNAVHPPEFIFISN